MRSLDTYNNKKRKINDRDADYQFLPKIANK